ncbi:hypothetical protein BH09ACT1_BH09ACT1_19490 [soil metagenome]
MPVERQKVSRRLEFGTAAAAIVLAYLVPGGGILFAIAALFSRVRHDRLLVTALFVWGIVALAAQLVGFYDAAHVGRTWVGE